MSEDIKGILDKFDKVLENYELDKKWGQMSVDSICHLFPSEMITIKDYITNLQEENERLNNNWNKLEEWLNIQQNISSPEQILNDIFSKLQELKGSDK